MKLLRKCAGFGTKSQQNLGTIPHKFGEYCRELEKELRKLGKYKFAKSPEEESKSSKPTGVEAAD